MPELTRRRSTDAREECWHVYYGDVQAGTITIGSGSPHDEDPWEWHCGFYPGSHSGEHKDGTAASFDEARSDFEAAWKVFLAKYICGHDLFNGAKNQHRLQDLSDSAIKSGLGRNDNVCRPIKCNLGLAKVCKDRSFDSLFV
jgi:hypothetical protein